MGSLIRFELKKIVGNRVSMIACAVALLLLVVLAAMNVLTAGSWDLRSGEYVTGMEAQDAVRYSEQSLAGTLDDDRVAEDLLAYDLAEDRWHQDFAHLSELSGKQIIDEYGIDFWREVDRVRSGAYYLRLDTAMTIDNYGNRAQSLREGVESSNADELANGYLNYFPYTAAERDYWQAKAAAIEWPTEYGYTAGWNNIFGWTSFLVLAIIACCIAVSGVFAREYQDRTAAVVLPTKRGKRVLPAAKVLAALIFASAFWWLCVACVWALDLGLLGADGGGLPFQVFDFMSPYPLTVAQVCLLCVLIGWVVCMGSTAFTLLLSSCLHSTMPVAVIPIAVIFLGVMAKLVTPLTKLADLTPMSGLNDMFTGMLSYAAGPVVLDLAGALVTLYAVLLVACLPLAMRAFRRHQVA